MTSHRPSRPFSVALTLLGTERLFGDDIRSLVDVAARAEAAGIQQIVLPDHVVIGPRTDHYPFGDFPVPPAQARPEPLTVLAALGELARA